RRHAQPRHDPVKWQVKRHSGLSEPDLLQHPLDAAATRKTTLSAEREARAVVAHCRVPESNWAGHYLPCPMDERRCTGSHHDGPGADLLF
ncbi:hypothetical protein ACFY84_35775, partial [Streptomyces sp. NPDC012438]|uniref:hypothetical protein n=1 Tax=Streptomyces sp. NPDC012438 TaxID=3364833 RepID=UPI0036E15C52